MTWCRRCFCELGKAYRNFGSRPSFPPGYTALPGTWRPIAAVPWAKRDRSPPLPSVDPPAEASPLHQLHYEDLVQRGLQALSLDHRAVLVLHDLEDLPQQEVASILNVPVGTVKSRLHHARAALRQSLQQEGVQL